MSQKPVKTIVLDSASLIKDEPSISTLLAMSEQLVTVASVIAEIRDANARSRLHISVLPFLTVRDPRPLSIDFINFFSKKTGDLAVLSRTDIEVLALTYELECEQNGGGWRLRNTPGQKLSKGSPQRKEDAETKGQIPDAGLAPTAGNQPLTEHEKSPSLGASSPLVAIEAHGGVVPITDSQNSAKTDAEDGAQNLHNLQVFGDDVLQKITLSAGLQHTNPSHGDSTFLGSESEPSESEGWITPSNMKIHQAKDLSNSTVPILEDQTMEVAMLSSDFAMQNVCLQIGLNLLSSSLQRVRNLRTYILRCHACFQKEKDMSKQFCSRCGKPTLTRVSCSTNAKGEFKIHLKKNMQWNHRGDRFSIPKPVSGAANGKVGQGKGGGKGGWGQELILAEDQKEYQRATSGRGRRKETALMDKDYLPGILTGKRGSAGGRPKIGAGKNINSKKRAS